MRLRYTSVSNIGKMKNAWTENDPDMNQTRIQSVWWGLIGSSWDSKLGFQWEERTQISLFVRLVVSLNSVSHIQ